MKPPKCRLCENTHWSHEPHKFASNTIETASNNDSSASNKVQAIRPTRADATSTQAVLEPPKLPKQRWDREAYNAYQREYMRKRRGQAA